MSPLSISPASTAPRALAFAILLQALWYVPTTLIGGVLLASRGLRTVAVAGGRQEIRQRISVLSTRAPSSAVSFLPSARDRARYEIGTS